MTPSGEMRTRILDAALDLLTAGGREAVTTRAVTSTLKIQAPTIYRIFVDKQGLLDATALHGFHTHLQNWTGWVPGSNPLQSLRQGWDMHIEWGLTNPYLYSIAYGEPHDGISSPAANAIDAIITVQMEQAAKDGLLVLPVFDAVRLVRAAGVGAVLTLLATPTDRRDLTLSGRVRDAVLREIFATTPASTDKSGAAMLLRAHLSDHPVLTRNEQALMGDWLDKIAAHPTDGPE